NGNAQWTRHPFSDSGFEVRTLAVADLENDGLIEMIAGRAGAGSTRQLNVFEPDGSVRPGWPARRDGEVGYGWGMYNQNAAAGDLDGNGTKEIIGPTDTHYITALDKDGNQLYTNAMYDDLHTDGPQTWAQVGVHVDHNVDLRGYANCGVEHRPNFADSAPVIADLDGNGTPEIIVVGNVYNCATSPYTSLYHIPFIFNADRSRWSGAGYDWTVLPNPDAHAAPISESYNVIETAVPNPVIADLDYDGLQEILYASYDGQVHAYWLDKTEHGEWPYRVYNPSEGFFRFASEPVVADLDNNGWAEVIFASWVQKGTNRTGRLHILDYHGRVLQEIDLPPAKNGDWNGAMAAPTLANIDLDPDLEVVLLTAHSGVVVYDLPNSAEAHILWGTGRGSYLRSGSK
ncbi:MAG: FG-GAP repeat domain-containing protein, partial [Anaerolineales bacterium]